LTLRTSNES